MPEAEIIDSCSEAVRASVSTVWIDAALIVAIAWLEELDCDYEYFKNQNIFLVVDAALPAIIASCSKAVRASVFIAWIDAVKLIG